MAAATLQWPMAQVFEAGWVVSTTQSLPYQRFRELSEGVISSSSSLRTAVSMPWFSFLEVIINRRFLEGSEVTRALLWEPSLRGEAHNKLQVGCGRALPEAATKSQRLWTAATHRVCLPHSSCSASGAVGFPRKAEEVQGHRDAFSALLINWAQ